MVSLIQDHAVKARENPYAAGVILGVEVGKQKVMVDHKDVCIGGRPPCLVVVTVRVVRASNPKGLVRIRVHAIPVLILGDEAHVGPCTVGCGSRPRRNLLDGASFITRR